MSKRNVTPINLTETNRGFAHGNFKDDYGNKCSIQKSSKMGDFIWLGIDDPQLTVFEDEKMGAYINTKLPKNWMVESRMHLSREQVKELLPLLKRFVKTGEIHE